MESETKHLRMRELVIKKLQGGLTADEAAELDRIRADIEAPFAEHVAEQERRREEQTRQMQQDLADLRGIAERLGL